MYFGSSPTTWQNNSNTEEKSQFEKLISIVKDPNLAKHYFDFGLRPFNQNDRNLDEFTNWENDNSTNRPDQLLIDRETGFRFRFNSENCSLSNDLVGSYDLMDAQELLCKAYFRESNFRFTKKDVRALNRKIDLEEIGAYPIYQPLDLYAKNRKELLQHIADLNNLFCQSLSARRLWFRGQTKEYQITRDKALTDMLYGYNAPSLIPSIGRKLENTPHDINESTQKRLWFQGFVIWLMRENKNWFSYDKEMYNYIIKVLRDENLERFEELASYIRLSETYAAHRQFKNLPPDASEPAKYLWPNEADDLLQWAKYSSTQTPFVLTLQQYGYPTPILDITDNIEVALYFSHASFFENKIRSHPAKEGRLIYVFVEGHTGEAFFQKNDELDWGFHDWKIKIPLRPANQEGGFLCGATNSNRNFYGQMVVAKIWLADEQPLSSLNDKHLFPEEDDDLLLDTLKLLRPRLSNLY